MASLFEMDDQMRLEAEALVSSTLIEIGQGRTPTPPSARELHLIVLFAWNLKREVADSDALAKRLQHELERIAGDLEAVP